MNETAAQRDDPAVKAIQELNDSVASSFEILEDDVKRLDADQAAGFAQQEERLRRVEAGRIYPGGSGVDVSWIPEAQREALHAVAARVDSGPGEPQRQLRTCTEFRMCTTAFLLASTMAQNHRLSGVNQAQWFELLAKGYRSFGVHSEKAAAFITTTETLGGHWLPDPVAMEIWKLITDNSVVAKLGRQVPMTTKTLDLPVEGSSALTVDFIAEGADITDSIPASNALNKVTLTAAKLAGYAEASLESLQDAAAAILDFVQTTLIEKSGRRLDQEALEGTGSPFTGVSNDTGVNEIAAGTNGDAITYPLLVDVVYKARERTSRDGARWFMAPETMAKVVGLVDDNNMPIFRFGNVSEGIPPTLLGFPAEIHSVIDATRTKGSGTSLSHVYFGPPKTLIVGNRVGMSWDTSDHGAMFKSYSLAMRLTTRVALALAVPKAWTRRLDFDV